MITEVNGDYWEYLKSSTFDAIVCTTNTIVKGDGNLVMGAGIAKAFAGRYPWLPSIWGAQTLRIRNRGLKSSVLINGPHENLECGHARYIIGFPTKYDWKNSSSLDLIDTSAWQLVTIANALDWKTILMTRPGCGLGGKNWEEEVKPILNQTLDERFYVVNK